MAAAILTNREMLSLVDKVKMVPGLLPMLIEGQDFIDAQDELSVLEFMEKYGMPDTVNEEIFIAMARPGADSSATTRRHDKRETAPSTFRPHRISPIRTACR